MNENDRAKLSVEAANRLAVEYVNKLGGKEGFKSWEEVLIAFAHGFAEGMRYMGEEFERHHAEKN